MGHPDGEPHSRAGTWGQDGLDSWKTRVGERQTMSQGQHASSELPGSPRPCHRSLGATTPISASTCQAGRRAVVDGLLAGVSREAGEQRGHPGALSLCLPSSD